MFGELPQSVNTVGPSLLNLTCLFNICLCLCAAVMDEAVMETQRCDCCSEVIYLKVCFKENIVMQMVMVVEMQQ